MGLALGKGHGQSPIDGCWVPIRKVPIDSPMKPIDKFDCWRPAE